MGVRNIPIDTKLYVLSRFIKQRVRQSYVKMIVVTLQRRADTIAKILILTFNDDEEKTIEKVLFVLSNEIGLEIKLHQRRVLRDGEDVPLTRLEYGMHAYLASSPSRVFLQEQIFEAVWDMNSDSCHSSVVNVIYNLRKKIEPDSKNSAYIKTMLGVGYKFDMERSKG